jgi:hypothetical protein
LEQPLLYFSQEKLQMKRMIFPVCVLLSLLTTAQDAEKKFQLFKSIQGTWSMTTKRGIVYESWQVKNHTLEGRSFKLMGKDTLLLEQVTIFIKGNDLFYNPVVEGQNNNESVSFKLVNTENETFIFDNPDHDFPQRVIYQLPKNDVMHAWIEGLDKGVYRKSDFYYNRVK